jgi:hypothetical protein
MILRALILCILIVAALPSLGVERCGDQADDALFAVTSWSGLGEWILAHPECDDGYFAEHISELVVEWLKTRPEELGALSTAARAYPELLGLALRHIDGIASASDLASIRENAERRCPDGEQEVCSLILNAARDLEAETRRERRGKE